MTIREAIKQGPELDASQWLGINILYTASWLSTHLHRVFRPYGISWQQFNILRILRGQKGKPASLRLVSERMIDQMSNTSRLVDKLVEKGLAERHQCPKDRRQVDLLITHQGSDLVSQAGTALDVHMNQLFAHVQPHAISQLNQLLDSLRSANNESSLHYSKINKT